MIQFSEETQKVGREIQNYLAASGMSRDELARAIKRGKSCIDKLCSGRYSEKTLAAVTARTKFVRSNAYASKSLGAYSKQSWSNYIGDYVMIEPYYPDEQSILVRRMSIRWVDEVPGLVMYHDAGEKIGLLSIPHERSPLLYIWSDEIHGRYIALSTMVGERAMRGLKLSVHQVVANAHVPVTSPVVFSFASDAMKDDFPEDAVIEDGDRRYDLLRSELRKVIDSKYGIFLGGQHD